LLLLSFYLLLVWMALLEFRFMVTEYYLIVAVLLVHWSIITIIMILILICNLLKSCLG
jgi:hypothetical protein